MFHSGDIYEIRARASRHQELRRLARAITGLFHRAAPCTPVRKPGLSGKPIAPTTRR